MGSVGVRGCAWKSGGVADARQRTPGELHLLAAKLTKALTNVHRIAVSRGERLPAPAYEDLHTIDSGDEDDQQDTLQPAQHD
ncbi:hypothetical protein [Streptomyces sp. NPDC001816]|uniref:hypothetical protein n=1 Tax=Streptomyces sp. NPDC001816 TaxID=3364612 RepID=UPI0036A12AB5